MSANDISNALAETNDFDLAPEKKVALSTLKTQRRKLNKLSASIETTSVINEFDRIKFAVNLEKYGEEIGFSIINLEETTEPRISPVSRHFKHHKELKEKYLEVNATLSSIDNITSSSDSFYNVEEIEDTEEELSSAVLINSDNETIRELAKKLEEHIQKYNDFVISSQSEASTEYDYINKNYAICYEDWIDSIGLNNLYIENRFLVIDVTGKFMASSGYLGKVDLNNIRGAFQRILNLNVVRFDIEKLYHVAQIFLCDLCIDVEYKNAEKVRRAIQGISSLFPIATNQHNIWKFHRTGLMLRSKAKRAGEALGVYHKGEELSYRNNVHYMNIIDGSGQELANRTLRVEHHLQTLDKIRKAFNIELKERRIVLLKDVLESQATPILEMFKKFGAEPRYLKEKIAGWIDEEPEFDTNISDELLNKIMISERYVEILLDNGNDIERTRNHFNVEYSRRVSDKELQKFNEYAQCRDRILSFLVYKKPKSITLVIELLEKIYKYYNLGIVEGFENE